MSIKNSFAVSLNGKFFNKEIVVKIQPHLKNAVIPHLVKKTQCIIQIVTNFTISVFHKVA